MLVFSARRSLPQANDWAVSYPCRTVEHCFGSSLLPPYALHSTTLAFNIIRSSKSPRATPSLCTPLYETPMHSSLQDESALDSPKSRKVTWQSTFAFAIDLRRKVMSSSRSSPHPRRRSPRQAQRWFLLEDDDHRIVRGKYKGREGKVTQVYRKNSVTDPSLVYITAALVASIRRSLVASIHHSPAAVKHYAAKVAREARIKP
ncbi:hypothetical protein EV715DRAFT_287055 [Schizophyllum commune]